MDTTLNLMDTRTGRIVAALPGRMVNLEDGNWSLTREGAAAVFEAGWFPVWGFPGERWGDWIVGVRKASPATR